MRTLHQEDTGITFLIFFITIILSSVLCMFGARNLTLKEIRKQAIENNAAEYVVDKDGKVTFKWKGQNE
jgi:hypothetical protein